MTQIHLSGQLVCRDADEVAIVAEHLPRHVALTRAETGCLSFEVTRTDDPLVWQVEEWFADAAAFAAHQERVTASAWGERTAGIERRYVTERVDTPPTADEVAARLRDAGDRWTTVRGVVVHHRRHDLVTVGFERYFAPLQGGDWRIGPAPADAVAAASADPSELGAVFSVVAEGTGRRRVEVVYQQGDDWVADLVVVDGDTWWARTPDGVVTNDGDERHRPGGTAALDLLRPDHVAVGHVLTPTTEQEQVAGRDCMVVLAVPRPRSPGSRVPGSEVFAMVTGGDRFRLSVDADLGVLLRVVKEVDGVAAETVEFTEIAFDVSLDEELFAPIA